MIEQETTPDVGNEQGEAARWVSEIKLYEGAQVSAPWIERSKKIVRRYKDDRGPRELKSRYNVLWSNVQTLAPAIYAKNPIPNVERRFKDDDALSRVSADVLERAASYFVKEDEFHAVMEQCVLDRLLCGRGTAWVRYVPHFRDPEMKENEEIAGGGVGVTDAVYSQPDAGELYSEEVVVDYIHWEDFGHTYARTWEEVRAVWKKVYMTREEMVERFGEDIARLVPLDYSPEKLNDTKVEDTLKKASIYEIWDKPSRKVYWIHKDEHSPLDTRDDPLKLRGFFPCPKPMFATLANDSIIPVPDYIEYQDQALELDELTARIKAITKAIKVAGVYDASAEGVQRLLAEGLENTLVQVDQYAVLAEKGGLKGVMDLLPMYDIMQTLAGLYDAREKVKQDLYEITGISDIIRGATNPNETLGAQQLKGQYADLRLGKMQRTAEKFARDLVRIIVEIVSEHFSLETIQAISGIRLMTQQEKMMLQQQMAMAQQSGQPMPPLDDQQQEMMNNPTWEEVYQLIKNDTMRCFRIDVETDSTIKSDQDAERDARIAFLQSVGGFMQQMSSVQDPSIRPLLMEMLNFGVRGFKVGKQLEGTFDLAMKKLNKQAENPAPPPPDPSAQAMMAQAQNDQARIQIEAQKAQADAQIKEQEIELKKTELLLKMQEGEHKKVIENKKLSFEESKIEEERLKTAIEIANQNKTEQGEEMQGKESIDILHAKLQQAIQDREQEEREVEEKKQLEQQKLLEEQQEKEERRAQSQALMAGLMGIQQSIGALIAEIQRPKTVIRNKNGQIEGVK
jgi:hypothetical protein